jgi:hypothetical protein
MGLVGAAHSSWFNAEGPEGGPAVLRREFDARLAELTGFKRPSPPKVLSLQGHRL